jgi:hypothetical protein
MSKKKWFLTETKHIINLQESVRFFITPDDHLKWSVVAEFDDYRMDMALFDDFDLAETYLSNLFNELCEENDP